METTQTLEERILDRAAHDGEYRALLLDNPRQAIMAIADIRIPDNIEITVHEQSSTNFHMVLPTNRTHQLTEEELATVSGGDDPPTFWDFLDAMHTAAYG